MKPGSFCRPIAEFEITPDLTLKTLLPAADRIGGRLSFCCRFNTATRSIYRVGFVVVLVLPQ